MRGPRGAAQGLAESVVPTPEDEDVFFQILEDAGQMSSAVVVDTMIASAWLGVRESPRKARWAPRL